MKRATRERQTMRGAALLAVLLLCLVLFVVMKALVMMAHSGSFQCRKQYERVAALHVASAAVAEARSLFNQDPDWKEGFNDKPMSEVSGRYTVLFHSGPGEVGPEESVNNLTGKEVVDGPRGRDTVPPYTADLVVLARVGATTRRVETVISRSSAQAFPYGLCASNHVRLQGQVDIDGIKSLSTGEVVDAGVHSNLVAAVSDILTWQPTRAGDRATVAGEVSVASPAPDAIDFGSDPLAYSVKSFKTQAPRRPPPTWDILGEIASNSSSPLPTLQPVGTSSIDGPARKYYYPGDLSLNGDLTLNDATLYVGGKLTVNGSISGRGTVYVAGDTQFRGDTALLTNNPSGVALLSKGSVSLTGFDGTRFLEALAANDPKAGEYYAQATDTLRDLQQLVSSGQLPALAPRTTYTNLGAAGPLWGDYLAMSDVLGKAGGRSAWKGYSRAVLWELADRVRTLPPGSTRDFMAQKLETYGKIFDDDAPYGQTLTVDKWEKGEFSGGVVNGIPEAGRNDLLPSIFALINGLDYNKLGNSYFQGVIYSNGYVYAANEVHVLGAVWARDDGSQPGGALPDGTELLPGDIFLSDGVRMTQVEEYLKSPGGAAAGVTGLQVTAWMER